MRAGNPKKYIGLEMADSTRWLLENHNNDFKRYCDGVGSTTTWFNRLIRRIIPNTIWGMDVTPASDLHDVSYSYPIFFKDLEEALRFKRETDLRFYHNLIRLITKKHRWYNKFLLAPRLVRAKIYYETVTHFGMDAFMKNKIY